MSPTRQIEWVARAATETRNEIDGAARSRRHTADLLAEIAALVGEAE
jgi:hypothetical protein